MNRANTAEVRVHSWMAILTAHFHSVQCRERICFEISHVITCLAVLICLSSCEANFFGPESREIAGGYRLKLTGSPNQFALIIPHENGGLIIDEIGWHEPLIVARSSGSEYWEVINTARAEHIRVSDRQRKSDPAYQSIETKTAETAWKELDRHKRLW